MTDQEPKSLKAPAPRGLPKPPRPGVMPISEIRKLTSSGQYDRAIREVKKVLEVNERSVDAMAVMAMAYFRKGEDELCRAVLDAIHIQQKDHPQYFYLWGHLHLKDGNNEVAQKFFEKAVQQNPRLLDAWTMIGVRHLRGKSYQEALKALLKAKALPGGNTYGVNLNIGSSYRGLAHRQNNPQHLVTALNYYQEAEKRFQQSAGNRGKPYLNSIYNKAVLYLDGKGYPGLTKIQRLERGIGYLEQYVNGIQRADPGRWRKEKEAVMKILNKAKNVDLPAAKAMAQARAAQAAQARPRPARPDPSTAPRGGEAASGAPRDAPGSRAGGTPPPPR